MSDPVEPWECKICKEIYGNPLDKVMECERCREHYCAKCLAQPITTCANYCYLVLHSLLSIREATYQRRTGKWNRSFDQKVKIPTMDNMKNMMNDLYKLTAGPSHGNFNEQTGIWKEVVNRKSKPLKEIILEATEEQKREEAEENRRKKNIVIYKAKESAATDSASRKKEDEKIVEIFLSSIEIKDKQIVKTIRIGRKTNR